jgi:HAD superfamily hydrolase (TIGR01509 family)
LDLRQKKFWIFDMDGTLTLPIHDFDEIRRVLGLVPGRPILEQLAEIPEERAGRLRRRLEEIELELAQRAAPQPGARDLLESLVRRGARLGILTRNSHGNALETLSRCGMAEFFPPESVLGREACDPKPSPDGIHRLLERWQAAPERAVMVGDYLFDLQAGREAGASTVYVGAMDRNEWSVQADVRVPSLRELRNLLEEAS